MKGIFVILDGIGDQACQVLGQKTPLEAANTPNLDVLAGKGKMDYCYTVKEGFVPESDSAIVSLLGYDYLSESRGTLEAMGLGIQLKNGDLALRCNFGTIDGLEEGNVLDRRAGRTLTTKEEKVLAKALNEGVKLKFPFEFYPAIQHRGVLVIRGGFSNNVSAVDRARKTDRLEFSKALDDEDDSKLTAELINSFVRQSFEILDKHPVNAERVRKGLYSANIVFCRGVGNEPIKFKKMKGKWGALAYMPLEIGIAKATGMDVFKFRYPKLRGIDVYENLYMGLRKGIGNAISMLRWNRKKYDYFWIHLKETDLPGHDNKPVEKVKMLEILDKKFFGYLKKIVDKEKAKLVLTGDHTTACRMKAHTSDPVPVLTYPHPKGKITEGQRFTEKDGLNGRKIIGRKLLEENLFEK
jgi:2,3-bisphosphoglycerate-independent phosphoglycerate mutase